MLTKSFNRVSGDTRGVLFNWSTPGGGGVYSWYWPNQYSGVASDLDNAATSLATGLTAAAASIEAADKQFKQANDVERVGAEACSRYLGPGFRAVRQAAISERQTTAAVRYSLRQPLEATASPNGTAVDAIQRVEIRQMLRSQFGNDLGAAYKWCVEGGLNILNAVVPYIALTQFKDDPQLIALLENEFAIAKTIKFMSNDPSDNFSTPADPLQNRMSDESLRILATAKIDQIKQREEAVDMAAKLLVATINFTMQSANVSDSQALDLLMGKPA
ncbi:hypothetical protein [Mesorhizobium sp. B2-8-9]|uniref:hypothetical protein n=1 Tax=Mesorhizobium sp. B2-8-9 TaxID=2589899 RepID=UPI0011286650|nr:hypothetical protein [Mesorhizobium sp. B2-8-9]TPI79513.1 hypothetical protein FJ423_15055 [Mesorhizobium sp. B2-8-9]